MILGIDTSGAQCAVAVVKVDGQAYQLAEAMTRGHADALFPMIDKVLAEAGADLQDVTRIAVCTGPGSFTGIRVGIAAARGLALGLKVPAVGITRLAALAESGSLEVAIPLTQGNWAVQSLSDGVPTGAPRLEERPPDTTDGGAYLPNPTTVARLGATAEISARPAPLYLRSADALPPSEPPVRMLD